MLLTIGFILIALWLIGFIIFPVLGWLIHLFLIAAVVVVLVRFIRGK